MRAECSSGKVNRATGASNPAGCVLACARGPGGSHVDNWVDLNWNKTVSQDERREHSLPREGSVMGGGGGDESHRSVQTHTCWTGWVPQGDSERSLCELSHVATRAVWPMSHTPV